MMRHKKVFLRFFLVLLGSTGIAGGFLLAGQELRPLPGDREERTLRPEGAFSPEKAGSAPFREFSPGAREKEGEAGRRIRTEGSVPPGDVLISFWKSLRKKDYRTAWKIYREEGLSPRIEDRFSLRPLDYFLEDRGNPFAFSRAFRLIQEGAPPPLRKAYRDDYRSLRRIAERKPLLPEDDAVQRAFRKGFENSAFFFLENGGSLRARDREGNSPLHAAALYGSPGAVRRLLRAGADREAMNFSYRTALQSVLKHFKEGAFGDRIRKEMNIRLLLDRKTPGMADADGETPLHMMVRQGVSPELFKEALRVAGLSRRSLVNRRDRKGRSPLMTALEEENRDLGELLLRAGADIFIEDREGSSPIREALDSGFNREWFFRPDIMRKTDSEGNSVFFRALPDVQNKRQMEFLYQQGSDLLYRNNRGQSALHVALASGNEPASRFLMKAGLNPYQKDKAGKSAADGALTGDDQTVLDLFRGFTELKNEDGETLLFYVIRKKKISLAQALIRGGADIEARNKKGETALYQAVKEDLPEMTEALLKAGARTDTEDRDGLTLLHLAVQQGNAGLVLRLIARGLPVNRQDRAGETALHYAVLTGNFPLVRELREKGADPLIQDKRGETPESLALRLGYPKTAEFLKAPARKAKTRKAKTRKAKKEK